MRRTIGAKGNNLLRDKHQKKNYKANIKSAKKQYLGKKSSTIAFLI